VSDMTPLEKLLVKELADIKGELRALREGKEEPRPRMLPAGVYSHFSSPKADVRPPAPAGDGRSAGMAGIYKKGG
jgi:hypothetical protein